MKLHHCTNHLTVLVKEGKLDGYSLSAQQGTLRLSLGVTRRVSGGSDRFHHEFLLTVGADIPREYFLEQVKEVTG